MSAVPRHARWLLPLAAGVCTTGAVFVLTYPDVEVWRLVVVSLLLLFGISCAVWNDALIRRSLASKASADGVTSEQFVAFNDAVDRVTEMINGFRARMESEGYSPTAAEAMSIELFRVLMRGGTDE